MRTKTREHNVEYVVAKKTLLARAAKNAGYELNLKSLPGMIGAAFGREDEIAPAVLGDLSKQAPLKLVGGILKA